MEGPSSHMQASGLLKRQQRWLSADGVSPAAPRGLISIYANDPVAPPTTQPPAPQASAGKVWLTLCQVL